ncbi:hypothetical protein CPB86DRAFT_454881 [Serendipita vermifera]|nr:hypothetical protein CPB86DRAFT_454881 [Serendipita vermifera]
MSGKCFPRLASRCTPPLKPLAAGKQDERACGSIAFLPSDSYPQHHFNPSTSFYYPFISQDQDFTLIAAMVIIIIGNFFTCVNMVVWRNNIRDVPIYSDINENKHVDIKGYYCSPISHSVSYM